MIFYLSFLAVLAGSLRLMCLIQILPAILNDVICDRKVIRNHKAHGNVEET